MEYYIINTDLRNIILSIRKTHLKTQKMQATTFFLGLDNLHISDRVILFTEDHLSVTAISKTQCLSDNIVSSSSFNSSFFT